MVRLGGERCGRGEGCGRRVPTVDARDHTRTRELLEPRGLAWLGLGSGSGLGLGLLGLGLGRLGLGLELGSGLEPRGPAEGQH